MSFDARYDHETWERTLQQTWERKRTYAAENNQGPLYSIDTPPPTVSGSLHIGHVFSYTQTDIIARFKRMQGYSVFYPFGFDDNGLPTERYVEKKRGIRAHALGRSAFIAQCLEETHTVEQEFKNLWQRMGLSIEWDKCYSTISDTTRAISQESFIELYRKGFIYRAFEPALYCTTCRTSVAQAELEDQEHDSTFYDIVFNDERGNDLIIGTTRPELLPACVAVLYNPHDERYAHLANTQARVPLFTTQVPLLADEHVLMDKGTGLVMCCTFGDKTDIAWFKKFKLPYKQAVGFDGKWTASTGPLAGLSCTEARKKVIELLAHDNRVIRSRPIKHAVNTHERCKKEIEYVALSQWFLKILEHKQTFIKLAEKITWYPAFMKARYINWVENISWDWCLSRQRFFGIPFPTWHCTTCATVVTAQVNDLPVDPQETAYSSPCPHCGSTNFTPDTDVMDTWNTSSLTPYLCYQYFNPTCTSPLTDARRTEFMPMSMRPQAHDIIRTWAFYTIVKSWMHDGTVPWHTIVVSGHVLTDSNQKISKSQGGTKLTPESLLAAYPADVIRYWTASGNLGHDVAFSENQLKIGLRLVTKLWNAFRFTHEHLIDLATPQPPDHELGAINQWLLHEISICAADYTGHLDLNEFGLALHRLDTFFWAVFCDTYIELIKHQLFNPDRYSSHEVKATKWTLGHVGLRILQLYAPYLPYVTEALYCTVYGNHMETGSVHGTKFSNLQISHHYESSTPQARLVIDVVEQVRKLKTSRQLSLKTELSGLTIGAKTAEQAESMAKHAQLMQGVTQAREIIIKHGASFQTQLEEDGQLWKATVSIA